MKLATILSTMPFICIRLARYSFDTNHVNKSVIYTRFY